jgi:hypothetical protein
MNNYDDLLLEESGSGRGYSEPEPLTEDEIAALTANDNWEPDDPLLPELIMGLAEDAAEHPVSTVADFTAPVAMLPIALPLRMVESGLREGMNKGGDFGAFKQGAKQELDDATDAVGTLAEIARLPTEWFVGKLDKPIGWLKSKMLKEPKPKYNPRFDPTNEDTYIQTPQVFREDYEW